MNHKNFLRANALVKQDELGCYDWIHEEGLLIVDKLDNLDEEHGEYLFQAYNIDRDEWAAVATHQIIILDNSVLDLPPIMEGCNVIFCSGSEVKGVRRK